MNFETKYIWESLPLLLQGLQLTILISMVGLAGGFIIGLLAGVCRALGGGIAKTLSLIFVELIRGTPIMVQVMFIYFALPMILPVRIDPITARWSPLLLTPARILRKLRAAQFCPSIEDLKKPVWRWDYRSAQRYGM